MIYNIHCMTKTLRLQGPEWLDIRGEWDRFRAAFLESDAGLDRWCDRWGQTPEHSEPVLSLCYCFTQMLRTVYGCEDLE